MLPTDNTTNVQDSKPLSNRSASHIQQLYRERRQPVKIMDVPVDRFTVKELHDCIYQIVSENGHAVIANVNVNAMNIASEQPWFANFLRKSTFVFCDGHGVILAALLLRLKHIPEKITYADWLPALCRFCAKKNLSLFLIGGRPGTAEAAAKNLGTHAPGLRIVGTQHGYFDKHKGTAENTDVVQQINESNADLVLTSFGMPLQEKWLAENWCDINSRIALTGGAALDYAAGTLKRPPKWLNNHGLEWLGRLTIEPGRLWKRYLAGNPLFFYRLFRYQLTRKD